MIRALILVGLAGLSFSSFAAGEDRKPLFRDHSVLKAVLTAPISQTYAQRNSDVRLYFPGQWSYIDQAGEAQRLDVSIRIRGNFRRAYCELPPIRLNFKKSQVEGTVFSGQDKLKLVAPCQHGLKSQQVLLLEYMAYRIYEILTDQSFGTRLIRLSYVDSDEKLKSWTDLAFVLEDEDDIGKRLGLDKANVAENRFEDLDPRSTVLAELFQLMISNHDYSVLKGPPGEYCCHNIEVYTREDAADRRIPIPYDFDMSGLVNAEYASPPSHLPIRLVRTRYYRGLCQAPEVMEEAIAHVLSKKQEILELFRNQEELSRNSRNLNLRYLGKYFAMLEDPVTLQDQVLDRCRGRERLEEMLNGEGERMGVPAADREPAADPT